MWVGLKPAPNRGRATLGLTPLLEGPESGGLQSISAVVLKITSCVSGVSLGPRTPLTFSRHCSDDRMALGTLACSGCHKQAIAKMPGVLAAFEPVSRENWDPVHSWPGINTEVLGVAKTLPGRRRDDSLPRKEARSPYALNSPRGAERVRPAADPCMVPEILLRRTSEMGALSGTTESFQDWPGQENDLRQIFFFLTPCLISPNSPLRPNPGYILRRKMWASYGLV